MITIDLLKERKRTLGYTNEDVARLSGVPLGTVQKVLGKTTKAPRRHTILAIAKVLAPEETEQDNERWYAGAKRYSDAASMVKENELAYKIEQDNDEKKIFIEKKQGEYTLEDYYAIPDERRVELIDGVIYDMTAPVLPHQIIAGDVYYQLIMCMEEHDSDCFPGIAPIDVQLDCDNRTMVQPDVIILCDMTKNVGKNIYGAPEFVLEVLSPSTRSKDQIVKLNKYKNAGCLEYWVVDPENERVMVYYFREENWPQIYSFDDKVPVRMSEGRCSIDFSRIKKKLVKFAPKAQK